MDDAHEQQDRYERAAHKRTRLISGTSTDYSATDLKRKAPDEADKATPKRKAQHEADHKATPKRKAHDEADHKATTKRKAQKDSNTATKNAKADTISTPKLQK